MRALIPLMVAGALALGLTACGGDDEEPTLSISTAPSATTAPQTTSTAGSTTAEKTKKGKDKEDAPEAAATTTAATPVPVTSGGVTVKAYKAKVTKLCRSGWRKVSDETKKILAEVQNDPDKAKEASQKLVDVTVTTMRGVLKKVKQQSVPEGATGPIQKALAGLDGSFAVYAALNEAVQEQDADKLEALSKEAEKHRQAILKNGRRYGLSACIEATG